MVNWEVWKYRGGLVVFLVVLVVLLSLLGFGSVFSQVGDHAFDSFNTSNTTSPGENVDRIFNATSSVSSLRTNVTVVGISEQGKVHVSPKNGSEQMVRLRNITIVTPGTVSTERYNSSCVGSVFNESQVYASSFKKEGFVMIPVELNTSSGGISEVLLIRKNDSYRVGSLLAERGFAITEVKNVSENSTARRAVRLEEEASELERGIWKCES